MDDVSLQTYTQTFRQAQCVAFDIENRLASVTVSGQTTAFQYDGDGNLVKKTKPDGSKTIYAVGGVHEVDKTSSGTVTKTTVYYPAAGAMRVNGTLYYILKDHLGSASVVTQCERECRRRRSLLSHGETRFTTGTMYTDKLYTGQREMAGLGIYHYGARFYSKLGRFLSADTIVPGAANPQAWNRYSYVLGNPLKYTDPTGHMQVSDDYTESDGVCDPGDTSCNWVGGGNNEEEEDDEPGHDYETEPNVVCPAVFECTEEEMQTYATMFQYPGQGWWNPVQDLETRYVFPATLFASLMLDPSLLLYGAITVDISDDGLTLINQSQPTHIFHNGKVVRDYTQGADGAWTVATHGTGTNDTPNIGPAIDWANDRIGAFAFDIVDFQMQIYIAVDQTLNR